jgi:hypothetical protein
MSNPDDELPADPKSWPRDPYRLLGVDRGVSPRDLRQAYHRMIRRYKPEHAPEEFQRIRAAYEAIQQHTAFYNASLVEAARPDGDTEAAADHSPSVEPVLAHRRDRFPSAEDLWERACQSETRAAYLGLLELVVRTPRDETVYLELYWLLVADPSLDTGRSPPDWLIDGLLVVPGFWRLRALLRRDMENDPATAVGVGFARLLAKGTPVLALPDNADIRWRAAQGLERWDVILDDVAMLRDWVPDVDEGTWLRLLIGAATRFAWAAPSWLGRVAGPEREALNRLWPEIEERSVGHLDLHDELHQLEFIMEVAKEAQTLRGDPGQSTLLRELLRCSWYRPPSEVFSLFRAYLAQVGFAPDVALTHFDRLASKAPAVLGHLSGLLEQLRAESAPRPELVCSTATEAVISRWLIENAWWEYIEFRPHLLAFCVREAIAPEIVASTLAGRPDLALSSDQHLADAIGSDWPLRFAYQACAMVAA